LREGEDRTDAVAKAYGTFAEIMGFEKWQGKDVSRERTAQKVIEMLRKVLKVSELTKLRS
jgi:hypothetical protein